MKVERYKFFDGANGIEENPKGEYVSYFDYQELAKQIAELKAGLNHISGLVGYMAEIDGYTIQQEIKEIIKQALK